MVSDSRWAFCILWRGFQVINHLILLLYSNRTTVVTQWCIKGTQKLAMYIYIYIYIIYVARSKNFCLRIVFNMEVSITGTLDFCMWHLQMKSYHSVFKNTLGGAATWSLFFVNDIENNTTITVVFLAATKQLYKWYFPYVCPSVTPFWLCSHHRIIMKFSEVVTTDQGKVHAKGQGQRSKVKVTEVTTQLNRFRTVTPVWIHIWWRNDAYSLMLLRRGALLFFKVICQISRSHGSKKRRVWPRLGVSGL